MATARKKTKKKKGEARLKGKPNLKEGDSVGVVKNGTMTLGSLQEIDESSGMAVIDFSTDECPELEPMIVPLREITKWDQVDLPHIEPSTPVHETQMGFNQYDIEWVNSYNEPLKFNRDTHDDPRHALRCKAVVEGVVFSGNINKTKTRHDEDAWQVLIYARYDDRPYALPPILYMNDPRIPGSTDEMSEEGEEKKSNRGGMRDLNGDICTAINCFLHYHAANIETVGDLRYRANNPLVIVKSFEELETLVNELVSLYNISVRSGGFRSAVLETPGSDVSVMIQAELTSEVIRSWDDKAPNIGSINPVLVESSEVTVDLKNKQSGIITRTTRTRRKGPKKAKADRHPELKSKTVKQLKDIKEELQETPKRDRSTEQLRLERAIREELRRRQ